MAKTTGKEKWAKHYSSNHQILLVGEGDFSFSKSLAMSFGSATNIVATSFDTYDMLMERYKNAKSNMEILRRFGAKLLHCVNAIKMNIHTDLRNRRFDQIVFNFPHSGPGKETDDHTIKHHKNLVQCFLWNARGMLRPNGEVHVTHKTSYPYNLWNIEEPATQCGLTLLECVEFRIEDYPGYNNKRGFGRDFDQPFPLGKCSTFKFVLSSEAIVRRPEFPIEKDLKRAFAKFASNPNVGPFSFPGDGLVHLIQLFTPEHCALPEGLEPSSSGQGTAQPSHM